MANTKWNDSCPLDNIQAGSIYYSAEEFIPDGSAGASFTDDWGVDGVNQMNVLYFNGAADAIAYLNLVVPRDYSGDATLRLYWVTAQSGITTTAVVWAGTARAVAQGDLINLQYSATLGATLTEIEEMCPSVGTSIDYSDLDLTKADAIYIQAGDYLQIEVSRNVSRDGNTTRVNLLGGEFRYTRGGRY